MHAALRHVPPGKKRSAIIAAAWQRRLSVKTLFGDRVRACSFEGHGAKMLIRCSALNRMTHLGMPNSYAA
jgi:hypothetical protein